MTQNFATIYFDATNSTMKLDGTPRSSVDGYAPPAVTLTFDLLILKSNQHIYQPKYICDQNWVKFPSLIFEIRCSQGFRVIACRDLDC